jgi:hypothetical protein
MHRATRFSLAVLAALAVVVSAAPAHAALGINLNWDDCTLGAPATNKNDACTSNFGAPNKLIVSMDPGGLIANVNGAQGVIDVQVDAVALPDYWRLDTGQCRAGNLSADVAVGSGNAPFSCPEPWASGGGNQSGGANFGFPTNPARSAAWGRITWIVAIPGQTSLDVATAPDYYLIAINLLRANTTSCVGCLTPACMVANLVRLTKPAGTPGGDVFVTNAAVAQHVTWQGGGTLACPASTPVQNTTWGQVKHLYR